MELIFFITVKIKSSPAEIMIVTYCHWLFYCIGFINIFMSRLVCTHDPKTMSMKNRDVAFRSFLTLTCLIQINQLTQILIEWNSKLKSIETKFTFCNFQSVNVRLKKWSFWKNERLPFFCFVLCVCTVAFMVLWPCPFFCRPHSSTLPAAVGNAGGHIAYISYTHKLVNCTHTHRGQSWNSIVRMEEKIRKELFLQGRSCLKQTAISRKVTTSLSS